MYSAGEVQSHFHTLATCADPARIAQSNQYLLGFQASAEAWGVCRGLLIPESDPHVLLMAAQTLYQKLRSEWHLLTDAQRVEMKEFLLALTALQLPANGHRKICQCLAFAGVNLCASLWEDFCVDILRIPRCETVLEVLDCVPFIVTDLSILRKTVELIKSRIRSQAEPLLNYLCTVISSTAYFSQVLEVLKDWRELSLPVLSHRPITTILLQYLTYSTLRAFQESTVPGLCDVLIEALSSAQGNNMLANGCRIYSQPQEKLFSQIDEAERQSVFQLIEVLGVLRAQVFSHSDASLRGKMVELATTLVSSYSLLLIYVRF